MKKSTILLLAVWISCLIRIGYSQENYTIKNIEIKGASGFSEDILLEQMNTRAATLPEKALFWKKMPRLSMTMLDNDLDRLQHFYQRHGYLKAKISYALERDDSKERVSIILDINENEPVRLGQVRIAGPMDSLARDVLREAEKDLPLVRGQRFEDQDVYQAEDRLNKTFKERGYPLVEIEREIRVYPDTHKADVHFYIDPGPRTRFGGYHIQGDSLVSRKFIKRHIPVEVDGIYAESKLDATQEQLFDTGLFRYVVVRALIDSLKQQQVPVYIEVSEIAPWSLETGVGYGTEDRFRASARLTKLRFFGGARKMILEGKHSYFLPISLEAKLIQPDMFGLNTDVIFNPYFIRENETSYTVDRLGGAITFQQTFSRRSSGYLMYTLERDFLKDLSVPDSLAGKRRRELIHNKSGITLGITRNTTDQMFNPTSGMKLDGRITYMGLGFQSRYHYYKTDIELRGYHSIDQNWILAGKIHAGIIDPLGGNATPIEDRYLVGGASSLRGWGRHEISPVNDQGRPVGGNSMLETSVELRFPVYGIFSGVTFMDAGNVWRRAYGFDPAGLRYNAGLGVRVSTPVGPVRVDLASPVFESPRKLQFFISIGHAF